MTARWLQKGSPTAPGSAPAEFLNSVFRLQQQRSQMTAQGLRRFDCATKPREFHTLNFVSRLFDILSYLIISWDFSREMNIKNGSNVIFYQPLCYFPIQLSQFQSLNQNENYSTRNKIVSQLFDPIHNFLAQTSTRFYTL